MAGQPRYVDNRPTPSDDYLSLMNNLSNSSSVSVPISGDHSKQYLKTRNGIFTGAYGSVDQSLTISTFILNMMKDANGPVVPRRTIHINPETGTTDTLIGIQMVGNELPYQELILIGVPGDTLTITHSSGGVSGTQRPILCPGNTDYTITGDEAAYLIYDTSLLSWIITGGTGGGAGDDLGNHTAIIDLNMSNQDINNVTNILLRAGIDTSKLFFDGGSDTYITGSSFSGRINVINDSANVSAFLTSGFLTTDITCANISTNGDIDLNSNDILETGNLKFSSTGVITGSDVGFSSLNGELYCNVQANDSFYVRTNGNSRLRVHDEGIEILNTTTTRAWLSIDESTIAPTDTNVTSNECKLFCVDNGAGKTILKVQFDTGSPITIATEA